MRQPDLEQGDKYSQDEIDRLNAYIDLLRKEIKNIITNSKRCCCLGEEWHEVYINFSEMDKLAVLILCGGE